MRNPFSRQTPVTPAQGSGTVLVEIGLMVALLGAASIVAVSMTGLTGHQTPKQSATMVIVD